MGQRLKRAESLKKGLQRVSERRLKDVLQVIGQQGLTAEAVHEVRKTIKSLRAILRLSRGAMTVEERKARNGALREFAGRLSGPRDAAVTLTAFEKIWGESLVGSGRPEAMPSWAARLQESLAAKAHALVPAESYRNAAERVSRFSGELLPFDGARPGSGFSHFGGKNDWSHTFGEGLRKTYRQGRRLMRQVAANSEAPEEQWHELRKRAKDLLYQLALIKKLQGVKPLLAKLEEVGTALGDARDLVLLRDQLCALRDKQELNPAEQQSFQTVFDHLEQQRERLHRRALQAGQRAYRRSAGRFIGALAKRWAMWKGSH